MFAARKLIPSTHPILNFGHPTLESFTWNNIIRAHAQASHRPAAPIPLFIYLRMRLHGVKPDFHTFPFLLQSFNSEPHLFSGKQIQAQSIVFGLDCDSYVKTCLINMYSCCGRLKFAQQVFDEISQPDLPSWNSIINANVKVGLIRVARNLFDQMPDRNVISWSCMINGYVNCSECKEALELFHEMQMQLEADHVRPNEVTMSAVLSACARLGALEQGKWIHAYIDKNGMNIDTVLGTSLIDMYAKCGSIDKAIWVFNNLGTQRDVKMWTATISGLAMHGYSKECLDLFEKMKQDDVRPNAVTFLSILCACVHGGLVNKGNEYFGKMKEEYGITPLIEHYGCMVDLYGRAGQIDKARDVIQSMPMEPDVLIWGALLSGSRMHGEIDSCETSLKKLIELEPTNSGAYVLLSNVYAKMGKWGKLREVRNLMEMRGVRKVPGCSLVEVEGVLHEFSVGDNSHPESEEIYMMADEIIKRLKIEEGYMENVSEVLIDLDDDEEGKEMALSFHSEKLAVAYCFLKTKPGSLIRVIKNLRICSDCHVFMKLISKVFDREIVVRDCNRFHHMRGGLCSCKDYW